MALYYNLQQAAVELRNGTFTIEWGRWFQFLFSQVDTLTTTVNGYLGVNEKTYTQLNALNLGAGDAGYLAFEPNYGHLLRWTGSVWQFAPGDPGNGYFEDFAVAPQQVGWALCNGSATDYLVVGGVTLSVSAITPPAMTGYYRKGAAAYTGTQVAGGITGSMSSAGTHDHGGSTGSESSHTHDVGSFSGSVVADFVSTAQYATSGGQPFHVDVVGTSGAGSAHSHSISSDGSHTHGLGTLGADVSHVDVTVYFRR